MSKPRLTLIARADNTGLGAQTWEFARHMKPDKVYVIDLTAINASMGKKTDLHLERFPGATVIDGFPKDSDFEAMVADTDVIYTVEIPYGYQLFDIARKAGVKTVLHYNFEFLDYLQNPDWPKPDLFLAPAMWRMMDAQKAVGMSNLRYLPVPTATDRFTVKPRTEAKHFLHIAGHPAHEDRNGTWDVLGCLQYVRNHIELTIKVQNERFAIDLMSWCARRQPDNVTIHIDDTEVENYWDNFGPQYDVLLLPRKYGGLSLQRNEAMAAGMPVVMTDIEPNNLTLPAELLVRTVHEKNTMTRTTIEVRQAESQALAEKIDWLYDNPSEMQYLSGKMVGMAWHESWEQMAPKYWTEFEQLCQTPA